jgi:hypothetical protein
VFDGCFGDILICVEPDAAISPEVKLIAVDDSEGVRRHGITPNFVKTTSLYNRTHVSRKHAAT